MDHPTTSPSLRKFSSTPPRSGYVGRARVWLRKGYDPLASLYLTIPVFLVYHLGILFLDSRNGVDLVSQALLRILDHNVLAYALVTFGYAAGIMIAVGILRRRCELQTAAWLPILGESVLFAVLHLVGASWMTHQLVDFQVGVRSMGAFERVVMSAGAGFHEEIFFRVGLFSVLASLLGKFTRVSAARAVLIAALASSVAFSSAHYIGAWGDDFAISSFTYRVVGGLILIAIYRVRGFAVAVYSHVFYDIIVLFLL